MTDIVERLRRRAFRGPTMEAAHTKTVEWGAADEIERLREALRGRWRQILRSALEGKPSRSSARPLSPKQESPPPGQGAGGAK